MDSVIIGGAGVVGRKLEEVLKTLGEVVTVDRQPPADLVDDVLQPSCRTSAALLAADMVVLALPVATAIRAVRTLATRPDILLVDTTSVKSGIVTALEAAPQAEALSINPMFDPRLGFSGRPIAVVPVRRGPIGAAMLAALADHGAQVVELSSIEHDRFTAGAQVATHAAVLAFGTALERGGIDVQLLRRLGPPPLRLLLAVLARIVSGSPEVYWDIQASNPAAAEVRQDLVAGVTELGGIDATDFERYVCRLREYLGAHREPLARECAALFRG